MNDSVRVLVVDDESGARDGVAKLLVRLGYWVDTATDGAAALALAADTPPDVVLTDLRMPDIDGLELLARLHARDPDLPVLVVSGYGDVGAAVAAMRAGAADFLAKPVDGEILSMAIRRALERRDLKRDAENLRRQLRAPDEEELQGLNGTSAAMQRIYRLVRRVAPSRATVLVSGESGTGKGELARAIHALSPRAREPFVVVHCSALPDNLLESELFGHERGSFTGADRRRIGRFEQAHGGTLFLDEIGEISPLTQLKLLRVLQERAFERVGGNDLVTVDVRLIAATHRDLAADVLDGRFREDLYYRLNVVRIEMPPLRLRGTDVLTLAMAFLRRFAADNEKSVESFTDAARTKMLAHRWRGNVRELQNAMERAVVLAKGHTIDAADLPFSLSLPPSGPTRIPGSTLADIERFAIESTLLAHDGSKTKAAAALGVSVRTIHYRLQQYAAQGKGK